MDMALLEEVIKEKIAPLVAVDGGSVELVKVRDDGTVLLHLGGACSGCPGLEYTLNMVILPILKDEVAGVKAVESVPFIPER